VTENLVPIPPQGLVLALQFWDGDQARALRLARLLADIEPRRRSDVFVAFCRRFDMPEESAESYQTRLKVGLKFGTMALRSEREGVGHPAGPNALWSGTFDALAGAWRAGKLDAHSVFFLEADGCPLRADWLDRLLESHRRTRDAGRSVTGPLMQHNEVHLNGSLIAHLSLWFDRPSLQQTPKDQGWDMFHSHVLMAEGRAEPWIKNVYGACNWSAESLFGMSHETAWLASQKDDSALEWAERSLVVETARIRKARGRGCFCPDPLRCAVDACPCKCSGCSRSGPRQGDAPNEDVGDVTPHPRVSVHG